MKKNQKLVLLASLFAATTLQAETTFDIGFSAGYKHVKETWTATNTRGTVAHGLIRSGDANVTSEQVVSGIAADQNALNAMDGVFSDTAAKSFVIVSGVAQKTEYKDSFVMLSIPMQMKMDRFGLKLDLGYGIGASSKIKTDRANDANNTLINKRAKKSSLFEAALKASYDFNISESFKIAPFIGYEIQSIKRKMNTNLLNASVTKDKASVADSLFNLLSPNGQKSKKNTPVIGVDFKFAPSEDLSIGLNVAYAMPSVYTNGMTDWTSVAAGLDGSTGDLSNLYAFIFTDSATKVTGKVAVKDAHKKRANQFRFGLNVDWMLNQSWTLNLFANMRTLSAKQTKTYAAQKMGQNAVAAGGTAAVATRYGAALAAGSQAGKFKSNEYTFGLGATYKF